MIELIDGNILYLDVEAIVNPVNCVGVMGRGLALQFRRMFPDNFDAYANVCQRGEVQPGRMFVFEREPPANPRFIVNFPTKRHWRDRSLLEDIDAGLRDLVTVIEQRQIRSIAIPPLGSGLEWTELGGRAATHIELVMKRVPPGVRPAL